MSLLKDTALLTIDTSGSGLHRRGYREDAGEAPLKGDIGSRSGQAQFWDRDRLLLDPMCGSGTILIEAALMARNRAPGLQRTFASERWPVIGRKRWQ